jgi:hypothetical protein
VRLLGAFIAHEATTQLRSIRFKVLAVAYVVIAVIPALALYLASGNLGYVLSGGAYAFAMRALLPVLTALFATVMAVDAINRERDEGSFGVISLAPVSASGYLFRRWIALLAIAAPLTLLPLIIAAGLAAHAGRRMPDLAPLAWEWLLHVAPPLVVMSALMLALGTITGRTILAVLAYGFGLTFGLGFLQDALAFARRKFEGPGQMIGFDPLVLERLVWTVRGFWQFDPPSAAGYPLETELDRMLPESALMVAVTLFLIGIAPAFLRRSKRDVKPWRIREDHQFRTMLRGLNRMREEYRPDAGLQTADRVVIGIAALSAIACLGLLVQRDTRYMNLAKARYAAEESKEPREMSTTLIPRAIHVEGKTGRAIATRTTFTFENRGARAERHLAFALHPSLHIEKLTASCGKATLTRKYERVGVDLDRELAPNAPCTLTFDVRGTADAPVFNFQGSGRFGTRYRHWLEAKLAIDLSDLSRSSFIPAATRHRLTLAATDFAPVPRYTPWHISNEPVTRDRDVTSFVRDSVLPTSDVRIALQLPEGFTAADSCGTVATNRIASRCAFPFADFRITGARYTTMPLGARATLLHLPPHDGLARMHAPALAEAITVAERAWPGLGLSGTPVFVEKPIVDDGERASWFNPRSTVIDASGAVFFIPEWLFIRRKALESPQIAASIISSTLRSRRAVPAEERRFFDAFLGEVARARTGGGEQRSALIGGRGPKPSTTPLIRISWGAFEAARLRGVIVDLEYRVGADRLIEAVNEFAATKGTGTAKELFDIISRRANVSLDNVYRDYVLGDALPKLTIEDATFTRDGKRWIVRGVAHNIGSGEVICPVVLRTQFGSVRDVVRIGGGERVPFTLTTEYEPRTLQLDPDRVVYRQAAIGTVDSIDFKGES